MESEDISVNNNNNNKKNPQHKQPKNKLIKPMFLNTSMSTPAASLEFQFMYIRKPDLVIFNYT